MSLKMIHTLVKQGRHPLKVNLFADRGPPHMEVADRLLKVTFDLKLMITNLIYGWWGFEPQVTSCFLKHLLNQFTIIALDYLVL